MAGEPLKILHLTGSLSRAGGGVFEVAARLCQAVETDPGCRAALCGIADDNSAADLAAFPALEAVPVGSPGLRGWGYSPDLMRLLRRHDYDVIHCHGLWMFQSLAQLAGQARRAVPYIISPHGMLDAWALRNARWKKRIVSLLYENRHLRNAACLHVLNAPEADAVQAFGFEGPVCIVPSGVDLPEAGAAAGNGDKVLLFLGRLHPKKGLAEMLKGWKLARMQTAAAEGWVLRIAGWGDEAYCSELRALCHELGLDSTVEFLGPVFGADKEAALRSASAFILPSHSEGLPMAVLEAFAYGIPAILTDACNLPDAFQGEAALRVTPEPGAIADGLALLFEMPDAERRHMGEAARALVTERYTWDQAGARMRDVYNWLAGRQSQPAWVV